jgi:hypothetical protein
VLDDRLDLGGTRRVDLPALLAGKADALVAAGVLFDAGKVEDRPQGREVDAQARWLERCRSDPGRHVCGGDRIRVSRSERLAQELAVNVEVAERSLARVDAARAVVGGYLRERAPLRCLDKRPQDLGRVAPSGQLSGDEVAP